MVHLGLKGCLRNPLYLELKEMLLTLDSLKEENKLWSSRCTKGGVDLSLSSIILWFTYRTYVKLNLVNEVKASLRMLESLLKVKLKDIRSLPKTPTEDLVEIFQCLITILKYYDELEVQKLAKELHDKLCMDHGYKEIISIMSDYDPYTIVLPSLIALTAIYLKKQGYKSACLDEVIRSYVELIKGLKSDTVDPSAVYWITENLLELASLGEDYIEIIKNRLKQVELIIVDELTSYRDYLEQLPIDKVLWYYHAVENLVQTYRKLNLSIDTLKELHKTITNHTTSLGVISWMKTTYAGVLRRFRNKQYPYEMFAGFTETEAEVLNPDLVTLSLLIGAYERMEKHIVTYVTDYDLKRLAKVENATLIIGTMLIFSGSALITMVLIKLGISQITSIQWIIGILPIGIALICCGYVMLRSLVKGEIKKPSDLVSILVKLVKIIKELAQ